VAITDFEQVTPEWLTGVLRRNGFLERGAVTSVEMKTHQTNTAAVANLRLSLTGDAKGGVPRALFLKLSDFRREVDFYQTVVPAMQATPLILDCYDADYDEAAGAAHLLLEDVTATHLTSAMTLPPSTPRYELLTDALAQFHAAWWDHPRIYGDIGALAGDVHHETITRARDGFAAFVDFMGDRMSDERRAVFERVLTRWPPRPFRERMAGADPHHKGLTVIHGDAHAWNFLYPRDPEAHRVRILDWALWQVGPATNDLAYMIAMHDFPDYRARMERPLVRHYYDRLVSLGVEGYTWDDCWLDYRLSAIHNLFFPVYHWVVKGDPALWWPNMERAMLAYHDLRCEDLLDD